MPETKTIEEIFDENVGSYHRTLSPASYENTVKAMTVYASQQSRSTAIGFALWMNEEDCQATPCGWVMSADAYKGEYSIDQLYDLYVIHLQSLNIK